MKYEHIQATCFAIVRADSWSYDVTRRGDDAVSARRAMDAAVYWTGIFAPAIRFYNIESEHEHGMS